MTWDEYTKAWKPAADMLRVDTGEHELTVLHEDGLYRHIRLAQPGTAINRIDIVTWPGHLSIGGDRDGYVFSRIPDMFEFFRAKSGWNHQTINPQYWAEKLTTQVPVKKYSEDRFRQHVIEHFVDTVKAGDWPRGLGKAIREEILEEDISFEDGARMALRDFDYEGWRFLDTWEWDLGDWDFHFLYACHAIQWGIDQYDKARAAVLR